MNFKEIPFILSLFIALTINTLYAQPEIQKPQQASHTTGTVMGSIVDANNVPLQYASVNVRRASDSVTAQYGLTDETGKFILEGIPFGQYFVEIQYVGYHKSTSPVFEISKTNAVYRIPKYKMTDKLTELSAVVIRAQKDALQTNLDKTVYNVESSINASGASAVEVLEEIPAVQVDIEGNVSLRGSENVTILVDGRPTNLTLDQIPADMIESVEVITNPSARLEPDGMAGILNVILKKKKESGFNAMLQAGGSMSFVYQDKHIPFISGYNAGFSFNYRYDKINIFFNYGYRAHSHRNGGTLWRDSWNDSDSSHLEQQNFGEHRGGFHNANLTFDYFINKYNTITFGISGNLGNMRNISSLNSLTYNLFDNIYDTNYHYFREGASARSFKNIEASINYKKTFLTPGRELTADLFFSQRGGSAIDTFTQHSYLDIPDFFQKTNTIENNRNAFAQVDFVTPIGNGGRIETGYKFSYREVGQDYSLFEGLSNSSASEVLDQRNDFTYYEFLNAAYFIYSNTFWKKLSVQAGLRGEIANTISDLRSADTAYHFDYYSLFPTLHIKYDITENHTLQLSYSRRVSRPRIHQLNPFINYSDRENLSQGNPYLKPEIANSTELGYMFTKNATTVTLTAFYRLRTNMITRYTEILQDPVTERFYTMTSYQNLNKGHNFGIEAFVSQRVKKVWKVNVTGSFYRNIIESNDLIDENLSRDWVWSVGCNQTFTVGKDFDIQLNFRYRSSTLTAGSMGWGTGGVGQGRRSPTYRMSLGVKKGFLDNSLVLSLNVRNLLYWIPTVRQTKVESWSGLNEPTGYYSYSIRENDGSHISFNLTYKFNNYKNRQQRQSVDEYGEGEGGDM